MAKELSAADVSDIRDAIDDLDTIATVLEDVGHEGTARELRVTAEKVEYALSEPLTFTTPRSEFTNGSTEFEWCESTVPDASEVVSKAARELRRTNADGEAVEEGDD